MKTIELTIETFMVAGRFQHKAYTTGINAKNRGELDVS